MKNIELAWKEFNVNAQAVRSEAEALAPGKVLAVSCNSKLEIHCEDSITAEEIEAIEAYWAALDEESDEATSYRSQDQIKDAIADLKAGLLAKSWDAMSVVERKLVIGQEPTLTELLAAELI